MAYPHGRVETAIQDLVKAFKGLTRAKGYRFTTKLVSRHLRDLDDLDASDVPAIFIIRPRGDSEQLTYIDSGIGGGYMSEVMLQAIGFVRHDGRNPDAAALASLAEAFLSDIRVLHLKDPRFGSAVIQDSTLLNGAQNDAAFDNEGAAVVQPFRIRVAWDIRGTNLP